MYLFGADFAEATRNILLDKLQAAGLVQGPFMFTYHEAASLMDISAFCSPVKHTKLFVFVSVHYFGCLCGVTD